MPERKLLLLRIEGVLYRSKSENDCCAKWFETHIYTDTRRCVQRTCIYKGVLNGKRHSGSETSHVVYAIIWQIYIIFTHKLFLV